MSFSNISVILLLNCRFKPLNFFLRKIVEVEFEVEVKVEVVEHIDRLL